MNQIPDNPGVGVLMMDFQNAIVQMIAEPTRSAVLDNAGLVLDGARRNKCPIFHVVVRFREGHPEVAAGNKGFAAAKAANLLVEGTFDAEIFTRLAPLPSDPVVVKRRVSAFGTTDLEPLLRARNVRTLVLAGLVTSGVVLSTLRQAADLDYSLFVVKDACADADEEVHRVLTEKVFVRQATVISAAQVDDTLRASG